MKKRVSNFNKVNLLSFSRIILSFISVMLLLTGDVHLILISFAIMAISEATDLIDGNVARREGIVTDLGKILDPMSDSISRFLYFFAFAYHGLFPIWFLIIFYLRDIAVAKIRLTSSLSGFVMGARFSGKLKSTVLFIGQYILLIILVINSNNIDNQPSNTYLFTIVIIGYSTIVALMYFYKIKGWLLYFTLIFGVFLVANILLINQFTIKINYLTTFSIAFFMFAISLYALIDYFFALFHKKNNFLILTFSAVVILSFFTLTPYSIDYFNNSQSNFISSKEEKDTNIDSSEMWKSVKEFKITSLPIEDSKKEIHQQIEKEDFLSELFDFNFHIYDKNSNIIPIFNSFNNNQLELLMYDKQKGKFISEKPYTYLVPDRIKSIDKLQFYDGFIYLLDNKNKNIFKIKFNDFSGKNIVNFSFRNTTKVQEMDTLNIDKTFITGYSSNLSFCIAEFNSHHFLLLTNYLYSNTIDFVSIGENSDFNSNLSLRDQVLFNLNAEVYIEDILCLDNKLLLKLIKCNSNVIYKVDLQKYIVTKNLRDKNTLESVIPLPHKFSDIKIRDTKTLYQFKETDLYFFDHKIY